MVQILLHWRGHVIQMSRCDLTANTKNGESTERVDYCDENAALQRMQSFQNLILFLLQAHEADCRDSEGHRMLAISLAHIADNCPVDLGSRVAQLDGKRCQGAHFPSADRS